VSSTKSVYRIGITVALLLTGTPLALGQSAPTRPGQDGPATNGAEIWDSNRDGVYTCDEWKSHLDRMFTLADRNRDGRLDASEFATIRKTDSTLADADFGYFDENQDGKITRSEFVNKPSVFILRFDRNGDCRVTPDGVRAAVTPPRAPQSQPVRDKWH
jgi:hypothetical protein